MRIAFSALDARPGRRIPPSSLSPGLEPASAVMQGLGVLLLCVMAGCATIGGAPPSAEPSLPATAPPLPRTAEPPAPKINLSGFPLPYRQGYADGCASASGPHRQDAERFGHDGNYSMGWQDGIALCKKPR